MQGRMEFVERPEANVTYFHGAGHQPLVDPPLEGRDAYIQRLSGAFKAD
ncbi:hypothetical protein [Parvularcula marina]|nr:hypothetical protein [Parvularcula marina]